MRERLERTHCTPFMDILNRQFGLVVAYLLPGFVALAGLAPVVPVVGGWLDVNQTSGFAAPVYALLAATAAGMIVSCFRWFLLDPAYSLTGVAAPSFNAQALNESPAAFNYLVESHYRYFQFYSNTLVAVIWTYSIHRWLNTSRLLGFRTDLGVLILCAVIFAGSRDALTKYRNRSSELAGQVALNDFKGEAMTNGIDHNQGNGGKAEKPSTPPKSDAKPEAPAKPKSVPASRKQSK